MNHTPTDYEVDSRQHIIACADSWLLTEGLPTYSALAAALRALVDRCDGAEGVRADGSNIDTCAAHAVLGDFAAVDA